MNLRHYPSGLGARVRHATRRLCTTSTAGVLLSVVFVLSSGGPARADAASNVPRHHVSGGCLINANGQQALYAQPDPLIEPWWHVSKLFISSRYSFNTGAQRVWYRLRTARWNGTKWVYGAGHWIGSDNGFKGNIGDYLHEQTDWATVGTGTWSDPLRPRRTSRYPIRGHLTGIGGTGTGPWPHGETFFTPQDRSVRLVGYDVTRQWVWVGYEIQWLPFTNSQHVQPPLSQTVAHTEWLGRVTGCSRT